MSKAKFAVIGTAKLIEAYTGEFTVDFSRATKNTTNYPFATMKKGESFLLPVVVDVTTAQRSVSAAACTYVTKEAPTKKFATRQVKSGVRVWRIK